MYCNSLNYDLSFFPDKIDACCSGFQGPIYIENPSENLPIDINKILDLKKKFFSDFKNNNIPKDCIGCPNLKNGEIADDFKIKKLVLNHFTHCNCKCTYCARLGFYNRDFTESKRASDYYDIFPIIKALYERNLIDKKHLCVEFQGGDCSVLEEFENVINFLLKNEFKEIYFTTNNIIYQPVIEECLKLNKGSLITALDCGCRETFKKIKRVDKFDDYVNNLITYRKRTNSDSFLLKYIVVKHINDNINELQLFLNLMKEIEIKNIFFDADYNDILMNKGKKFVIPTHYYEMKNLCEDFCQKNNMNLIITEHTKGVFQKGFFE